MGVFFIFFSPNFQSVSSRVVDKFGSVFFSINLSMNSYSKMTEVPTFLIDYINKNQVELPTDLKNLINEFHERRKYCRKDLFALELDVLGPEEGESVRTWQSRRTHLHFSSPEFLYHSQSFIKRFWEAIETKDVRAQNSMIRNEVREALVALL